MEQGRRAAARSSRPQRHAAAAAQQRPGWFEEDEQLQQLLAEPLAEQQWQRAGIMPFSPAGAVQQQVSVLWEHKGGGSEWYRGTLVAFDSNSGKHTIKYDDEPEPQDHLLAEEDTVRWLGLGVETSPGTPWPAQASVSAGGCTPAGMVCWGLHV